MKRANRAPQMGAVLCGVLLVLSACGDYVTDERSTSMGTNGRVGEMRIRNLYLVAPQDRQYEAGQQARVRLTLINEGQRPDALTRVSSEVATTASLHWDRACDGTAESVDRITVTAGGLVPQDPLPTGSGQALAPPTQQDAAHQPYYLRLTVNEQVRRGTTVPITFTFAHAGTGSLDAMVASNFPKIESGEQACSSG